MPLPNLNTLGYSGIKERNPPEIWFRDHAPTINDYALYDVLDFWQDTTTLKIYVLVDKKANIANWQEIFIGTSILLNLQGDVGAPVPPAGFTTQVKGGGSGAIQFSNGGGNLLAAQVLVDGTTIQIVGNQLVVNPAFLFPQWIEIFASQAVAVNTNYIANGAALVVMALPAIAPQGSEIRVAGKGVGLWQFQANAGQVIYFGEKTSAVAGSISSSKQRDCMHLVCITANTEWEVLDGQAGPFNVV